MNDIFKKSISAIVLGAFTLAFGMFAPVAPALADDPVFHVSAPQQQDWQTVELEKPVNNQEGIIYIPLRASFDAIGTEIVFEPDAQKNKLKLTCGASAYELHTYIDNKVRYIGVSANGPWYQTLTVNNTMYVPMAFLQTLTNRQLSVVGNKTIAFIDEKPTWAQEEAGYVNKNPFWKGVLAAYSTTTQPAATQTAASAQTATLTANPAAAAPASVAGESIVATAEREMGVPYVWGGMSPNGFDCSGLTSYVFAQHGKLLPRTADAQQAAATPVAMNQLQPGDLVFWGKPAYHVGIYIGNGQYIHAPQPGQSVSVGSVQWYPFTSAGRI